MDEREEARRGKLLAEVLGLKPLTKRTTDTAADIGRYATTWGTKTDLGLFRTVKRIIEEGQ